MQKLILLHGALGSSAIFDNIKSFFPENFEIHTLNFSGHGGSGLPATGFSIDLFCDDVNRYIGNHDIEQASFFGYSMGGYVALQFAINHPQRVNRIFTLGTKFDWSPASALREVSRLDTEVIELKFPNYAESLRNSHYPNDWKRVVEMTKEMMTDLGVHHLDEEDYKRTEAVTRIALGDRDRMADLASSHLVSRLIPRGSLLVLPDTTHPFEEVNPQKLIAEMVEFFGMD